MSEPKPSPYFQAGDRPSAALAPLGQWVTVEADWLRCYPVGGVTANIWQRVTGYEWRVAWFGHIAGGARGTAKTLDEAKELCLDETETLLASALDELEARRLGKVSTPEELRP